MLTKYMPVVLTVGQVIIFPYYIVWLKELALTYTLFALLFAVHAFAAAAGYFICQRWSMSHMRPFYVGSGLLYLAVFFISTVEAVVLLQIALGMSQGYFRAWHVKQVSYSINAVQHYIVVGSMMLLLAFAPIILPSLLIACFGVVLLLGGMVSGQRKIQNK